MEAEVRVGDDIDPRRWGSCPVTEHHHIFAFGHVETAVAVEEDERGCVGGRSEVQGSPGADGLGGCDPHGGESLDLLGEGTASPEQDRAGGTEQCVPRIIADEVAAQHEDTTSAAMLEQLRPALAGPGCGQQRLLEILDVGIGPLVEDDKIDGELLQTEIFVGKDELASQSDVGEIVDADKHDRQVAGDPLRPKRALHGRRELRRPQAWIREEHGLGKRLEQPGVVGHQVHVAELDLRMSPGKRPGAFEGERVVVVEEAFQNLFPT